MSSQENIEVALERFNKEFERLARNCEKLGKQYEKISAFMESQKSLFRK